MENILDILKRLPGDTEQEKASNLSLVVTALIGALDEKQRVRFESELAKLVNSKTDSLTNSGD